MVDLPSMRTNAMRLRKLRLPVAHPVVERYFGFVGRNKQVHVIGHQYVLTNAPSSGCPPDRYQQGVILIAGEPALATLGANGQQDNCGQSRSDLHTMDGMSTIASKRR